MTSKELLTLGQGAGRPRSAASSTRFQSQSLGKFMQQQNSALDERTVKSIWQGFGSYVAKQMRNGKGVSVPKLGNFTFSAAHVDLAGTTNPNERDKQIRTPVFIVGKDFVSAVELRTGISPNNGTTVRPYDIKGASGIIPKVKINYTEVASFCGQTKDISRNGCEQVFRFLSDKVRKGEQVTMEIPFVGTFLVKSGIAAISFNDSMCEDTKGVTAKNHFVNKLFSSSVNKLNMQIHDQNVVKTNPYAGLGGGMMVTGDAENWLRSNLNISVQDMISRPNESRYSQRVQSATPQKVQGLTRYGSMRPEDLRHKSWALQGQIQGTYQNGGLTEKNKAMFDVISDRKSTLPVSHKRPMSAVTRTSTGSRMTNVPDVARMKLMIIASDVYKNRQAISEVLSSQKSSMRDTISSSEMQSILKKTGIFVEIGHLKALLREFGFNWNGPSCSFYDLFQSSRTYLYGSTAEEERSNTYFQSITSPSKHYDTAPNNGSYNINKGPNSGAVGTAPERVIQMIKDLFYSTRKSIYDIYSEAKLGSTIDYEGLKKVIQEYSNGKVNEIDIQAAFQYASKGKDCIQYQDFERIFQWELPVGSDWETKAIKNIREWMFTNGLASEPAFEMFLKSTGKLLQRKLTRLDFHKALSHTELRLSAPEIDGLFVILDSKQDGELDVDEWKDRIYEDSLNPLQMLREVVTNNNLSPDDLLFKMKLRIWDLPLDFPKLQESLRRLDPSLSESQLRHLAKTLKNKENKIEITALLRNLCGQEHETVDFRNKIFRQIYSEIHPGREDELVQLLENADPLNDGRVEPQGLKAALRKVTKNIDEETIERFIRFLDKDKSGKVPYMEFMARMAEVSNRDHNPFKAVVQRLAYFLDANKQQIRMLLKRLALKRSPNEQVPSEEAVSVNMFAQFLKAKIDKKRDEGQLRKFAHFMDIDKDGFISEIDLQTCLSNLNSDAFFKNGGEALANSAFSSAKKFFPNQATKLTEERSFEILAQIRTAFIAQKIAYREAFNRFDANKDGFLSFTEFCQGIDKILTLSIPIKEKIFALMDKNEIGMVDYPNFLEIIQISSANRPKKEGFSDNFDWENNVIDQLREWISTERITVEEAFKSFDKDFDGFISKDDLKWALTNILSIKPEEIFPTKLDRLFRLMDFYKTNQIQLSDFQRLVQNENPYSASRGTASTDQFRRSQGGGFAQVSTFDWKLSAIQQIGLVVSKKYTSIKESFEAASEKLQKVTYEQFKKFLDQHRALAGFNLTTNLIQKLFSELDPHKKGYLTEQDWCNAFQAFNWNEQILIELKNSIQCSFSDCDSAFEFFLTFKSQSGEKKTIQYPEFELAVNSLTSERFKRHEIQTLWKHLTEGGRYTTLDKYQFRSHFDQIKYTGNSTVRTVKTAPPGARMTIQTTDSSNSTWSVDVFEKLRQIIRTSAKSFEEIFREFDEDKNGYISQVEFRNAIRKLNLGLTAREIDQLMVKIDTNQDGKIDWKEFMAKFKVRDLDERLKERAKDKMGRLKELMTLHMTSPNDAFRYFDESKLGKQTYQEFSKLVVKLNELAGEKPPAYPVIKDLFDTIDIRKDGILDISEWQQTFGGVIEGNNKMSLKATPLNMWVNSREFMSIGSMIAKNRKMLRQVFEKITGGNTTEITFDQGKKATEELINRHFKGLSDDKLKQVFKVGELQGANSEGIGNRFDYMRILDVYKSRHAAPQL